jgi:hypothetical protein
MGTHNARGVNRNHVQRKNATTDDFDVQIDRVAFLETLFDDPL